MDKNPHAIVEDGKLLIVGRQIATNLNTNIDLLAEELSEIFQDLAKSVKERAMASPLENNEPQ